MNPSADSRKARTRSPAYPSIDLRTAVERAGVLWREEGRHPTAVNVAMTHWGYKAESSTGFQTVAALKKFNLVESEGGTGEDRLIKLSPVALTILLEDAAPPAERQAALRTAALGPRIHAELWDRFGAELPSAPSLRRFLVVEKAFNESVVDHLIDEYRATVAFARLGSAPGAIPRPEGGVPPAPQPATVAIARPPETPAWPPTADRRPETRAARPDQAPEEALPVRPVPAPVPAAWPSRPSHPRSEDEGEDLAARREAPAPPVRAVPAGPPRELPVPLDGDKVVRVPYPMTEEDFSLLIDTLQLWKRRLVRPTAAGHG